MEVPMTEYHQLCDKYHIARQGLPKHIQDKLPYHMDNFLCLDESDVIRRYYWRNVSLPWKVEPKLNLIKSPHIVALLTIWAIQHGSADVD